MKVDKAVYNTQVPDIFKTSEFSEWYWLMEDGSYIPLDIYEYHGDLRLPDRNMIIVYAHEQIKVYDYELNLIAEQWTR